MPPEVGILSFVNTRGVFRSSLRRSRALRAASASGSWAVDDGVVEDCVEVAVGDWDWAELPVACCPQLLPANPRMIATAVNCNNVRMATLLAVPPPGSIWLNQFRCGSPGRGRATAKTPAAKVTTAGILLRHRDNCVLRCCHRAVARLFVPPRVPGRCLRIWW